MAENDTDTIKVPALTRAFETAEVEIRKEEGGPARIRLSASSEYPVERFFGTEILDHSPGSVRMDRVKRGSVPLLFNHDMDDPIGMVDVMELSGGRSIVDAHFFEGFARAEQVQRMVEGGLRNVSLMYRLHKVEERKDGTFIVREWEPLEVSIVTIPADPTVGIGRSDGQAFEVRMIRAFENQAETAVTQERREMTEEVKAAPAEEAAEGKIESRSQQETRVEVRSNEQRPNAVEIERRRKQTIDNLCRMNSLDEKYRDHFVGMGLSVDEVGDEILKILEERGKTNPQPASRLGLTKRETQDFSLRRAILACATNDWKNAPFELECARAMADKMGRSMDPNKFSVPFEILERDVILPEDRKRDLTVATPGAGGYLVATENMGFIEILRNRAVVFRMGARRLSGLQGNVTVPRQSAAATPYWLANEAAEIDESQPTFVQMAMTPKTVGAYTEISRQLLLQSSPAVEGIVTDDLAQVVALGADLAALNGSGNSGQPQGLLGTSGIGSVTGTSLGYAGVLEFQTDVATANVTPVNGGYVTTPAVAALLMARVKFASTASPLWEGNIWNGSMAGFNAMTSNQIPTATAIFGDWQELVIGEWGVLEVEVNPYANFKAGIIGVRAMYSMDVGVRRPFAFSAASSIT